MRPFRLLVAALAAGSILGACQCTGKVGGDDSSDASAPSNPDGGSAIASDSGATGPDDGGIAGADAAAAGLDAGPPSAARTFFAERVQPELVAKCSACHLGERFAFASLLRAGSDFTAAETQANYQRFLALISIDAPRRSRLISKLLPISDPAQLFHAGGPLAAGDASLLATLQNWIDQEKAARCPSCGRSAPVQYLAYVEQPAMFWAFERDPIRLDHGVRDRARIVLQPIDPATFKPSGAPIDFLDGKFCGADNRCDFGNLSVSHTGDRMAFECRLSLGAADWVNDVRWNICVAEIGPDGKAVNPRFLMPPAKRNQKVTVARSDPLGLYAADGVSPLKGTYDMHFQTRRREERHPIFSPDDTRIYFSSEQPEPRSGAEGTRTYHGFEHLNHIVAAKLDGSDVRTIYRNEGGEADYPFFLRNGNVAFHTWNLERMDRHMYTQATADGMMELPILVGRLQGPNMWGKATQLANGAVLGITGRRRSQLDNYTPFVADHTLGLGIDGAVKPLSLLDEAAFQSMPDFPGGYCTTPPTGPACTVDRYVNDASYSPDGRAFIAMNPERTTAAQGEQLFLIFGQGSDETQKIASLAQVVPQKLGISLIDHKGVVERFLEPPPGKMLRYPAWVGRREPPVAQPWKTDEGATSAELHIADVPLWLSFGFSDGGTNRVNLMSLLDTVVALRVMVKAVDDNGCLNDNKHYRAAVNAETQDHPTHLGINNATGFVKLAAPAALGGDAYGDVPLAADRSVDVKVPAGKILLIQGIDKDGHAVAQRSRLLTLAPGQRVDTSVRRAAYRSQCASCHGSIEANEPFVGLSRTNEIPVQPLGFATTLASQKPAVDLTASAVAKRPMTFLSVVRPLLDRSCVSCHSGAAPKGELSLEKDYSPTANYPAGKWENTPGLSDPNYRAFLPSGNRVPGYNYSVSWSWAMRLDEREYATSSQYAPLVAAHKPLADMAPWDPAYQNLWANDGSRFLYLGGYFTPNFGRSDRLGGISKDAFLIEILSGRDLDPTRSFSGPDHKTFLSQAEIRDVMGVLDVGFPFMATCSDRNAVAGPNAGKPWGDPIPK